MSSSSITPSPTLWKACRVIMGYETERDSTDEYHKVHYNELNGSEVEWFEIREVTRIIFDPNDHSFKRWYVMVIEFSSPMTEGDIKEFLDINDKEDWRFITTYYKHKHRDKPFANEKVLYSYEGVKSGTKSAAKIAKTS